MGELEMIQGSVPNILSVWGHSREWEREDGAAYYDRQRESIAIEARTHGLTVQQGVGVFAVLSPNNDEASTYRAMRRCMLIQCGKLPSDYPVQGYPINKTKALRILGGEPPEVVLAGPKVTAFYYNTLNPSNHEHVTIDGHMVSVWCGRRYLLRGVRGGARPDNINGAEISKTEYQSAVIDFRSASAYVGLPTPKFQAVLWLTWKRMHNIRYTPPQLVLPLLRGVFPYSIEDRGLI